jgi:hypothetical protein
MRLLITDVTEMHQGNYCVAGWCAAEARMIGPLPDGMNWTGPLLKAHGVTPGAVIEVTAGKTVSSGSYPHRTEDTPIDANTIKLVGSVSAPWFGSKAPPAATTIGTAFQGHLMTTGTWNGAKTGSYVPEGTQVGSLAAVRIPAAGLELFGG